MASCNRTFLTAAATAGVLALAGTAVAQETLTVAGFGGNLQTDLRKTIWQPAAEAAGIELREETHDGLAAVRVQVQSGSPTWDVVHLGADECAVGGKEGLFEPLDYNTISTKGFDARGFVFYTHMDGRKGRELQDNPQASLLFHWPRLRTG